MAPVLATVDQAVPAYLHVSHGPAWQGVGVFLARPPSESKVARFVERERQSGVLSYTEVGATDRTLPDGYRHDRWHVDLGVDDGDRFDRAAAALRNWEPQRRAGLQVHPDTPVQPDTVFAIVLPVGPLTVLAGARIIYVVDEPDRWAFAYGTLASHPEQGEEYFGVVRRDGRVGFEITAFSRPRDPLARLGGPVARYLQVKTTRRYLDAMKRVAV